MNKIMATGRRHALSLYFTYPHELHGDELEALSFEPLDDLADKSTLDSVGLDHDEGLFSLHVTGHT
jgi:hypothetical protein